MINSIVDIKQQNLARILDLVRRSNGIYKKEISDTLQISMGTVSNLCRELKEADLIFEAEGEDLDTAAGRQPKQVFLKKGRYHIISIDCHRLDNVRLVLLDISGEIKRQMVVTLDACKTVGEFVTAVGGEVRRLCENSQEKWATVIGIGMAISAIFDTKTQLVVSSGIEIFENEPLKALLEKEFRKSVYVDNDSNLCAAYMLATHPEEDNLVYIFCSEGLGSGIISNRNLITAGASGYSSEICHIPIGRPEYKCELCGGYGCVQNDLSVSGFLSKYLGKRIKNAAPETRRLWEELICAVENKEPSALCMLQENGGLLGKLTSILTNIFDPDSIYIGGEIAVFADALLPYISDEVGKRRIGIDRNLPLICFDTSSDTIILGCVEQVFKNILSVPALIKAVRNTI